MNKSPSVFIREVDASFYTVVDSNTVLAIVGYATKGPTDKAVLVTSKSEFVEKFGAIPQASPYGHLAAHRGFNQTNQIVYYRVADETAATAERVLFQTLPSTDKHAILFRAKETGSETNNIKVVKRVVSVPGVEAINYIDVYYHDEIKETFEVSLYPSAEHYFGKIFGTDPLNSKSNWVTIEAVAQKNTETGENPNWEEYTPEVFTFNDGSYPLGVKVSEEEVEYDEDTASEWENGEYAYRVGTDGIPATGAAALFVAALGTDKDLANEETFNFHILITPDEISQATQNAAISLAESRGDFIYIADPPMGLTYDEVTEWHNGVGDHGRTAGLNSSFAATYWPWTKEYNPMAKEYAWVPPSTNVAEMFIAVDNLVGPWAAPAGDTRGRLITSDIETSPSFAQREVLYGDLNAVNPIISSPGRGVVVYGQKTTYRANRAVNRVNIRRTIIHIKKLVKRAMSGMIFEPNLPSSWARATTSVSDILGYIRANGGIDDFSVVINETTNPENTVAQGIMRGIITIVPVGTIERIQLDVKFLNPGATITE